MEIQDIENQFDTNINLPNNKNFFIIVGGNNSGKSTFLRSVYKGHKLDAYMVNVNRTVLDGEGSLDKNYSRNIPSFQNQTQNNSDDNWKKPFQTLQDFFNLKDVERKPILEWYNNYFPSRIYEEREDPSNSASAMFLKVDGYPITKQGSGIRATLEIFIKLFDPKVKILCIDEPEIGLEPYLQKYLFQAIKDKTSAEKKVFLATHSHHFLDYDSIDNNYVCQRNSEGKIMLEDVKDLKAVIFRLLGNTLSSLLLPENIIVLEGASDTTILCKCLKLLDKNNYAIHAADADGNIKYAVNAITQFLEFNDKNNSIYKNNIYVIADQAKDILLRQWRSLLPDSNRQLKVLPSNGIEYFYPERILKNIFSTSDSRETIIQEYLKANKNVYNGVQLSKVELAKRVSEQLIVSDLDDTKNELFVFLKTLQ